VDKEFRYLRILKVRTAVYVGLHQEPKPPLTTLTYRAGVTPYTSPYGFAGSCVFVKQSPVAMSCSHHRCPELPQDLPR
jgi:hypothetical protein